MEKNHRRCGYKAFFNPWGRWDYLPVAMAGYGCFGSYRKIECKKIGIGQFCTG